MIEHIIVGFIMIGIGVFIGWWLRKGFEEF